MRTQMRQQLRYANNVYSHVSLQKPLRELLVVSRHVERLLHAAQRFTCLGECAAAAWSDVQDEHAVAHCCR